MKVLSMLRVCVTAHLVWTDARYGFCIDGDIVDVVVEKLSSFVNSTRVEASLLAGLRAI